MLVMSRRAWLDNGMLKVRQFCRSWLPVLVWMALIFAGSTDALSSRRTSRILVPLLRWLAPGMSLATMNRVQYLVRKGGHVVEYAGLAILIWRGRRLSGQRTEGCWRWPDTGLALALATGFAISDEIHQSFSPSRYGAAEDVWIDGGGAVMGLALVWLWQRWRKPIRPVLA